MVDTHAAERVVFLRPGEFSFAADRLRISTLLRSCVSIVLWHPQRRHGGMSHYLLPSRKHAGTALDGRYADEAMLMFVRALKHYGTHPSEYRAPYLRLRCHVRASVACAGYRCAQHLGRLSAIGSAWLSRGGCACRPPGLSQDRVRRVERARASCSCALWPGNER